MVIGVIVHTQEIASEVPSAEVVAVIKEVVVLRIGIPVEVKLRDSGVVTEGDGLRINDGQFMGGVVDIKAGVVGS